MRARHIERSGFLAGRATWGLWLRDGRLSPTGGQGELLPARSLVSRHRVGIVNAPRCRVRAEDPGTWSSPTNRWPEGIIYDEVSASPREESGQRGRLHARRADDRGGHHWDLGGYRYPALRQHTDPGTRGQSASRYPHARVGREHVHRPHGCPAGRPNGPDAADRERSGTICGALHRYRAHTAPGWLACVERDLHLHLEQHRDLLDYRQRRRNDDHRSVSGSCAPASPEASRRRGQAWRRPPFPRRSVGLMSLETRWRAESSRFGECRRPTVWATYTMKRGYRDVHLANLYLPHAPDVTSHRRSHVGVDGRRHLQRHHALLGIDALITGMAKAPPIRNRSEPTMMKRAAYFFSCACRPGETNFQTW